MWQGSFVVLLLLDDFVENTHDYKDWDIVTSQMKSKIAYQCFADFTHCPIMLTFHFVIIV